MFDSTGWLLEESDNKFDALMATVVRPDTNQGEARTIGYYSKTIFLQSTSIASFNCKMMRFLNNRGAKISLVPLV